MLHVLDNADSYDYTASSTSTASSTVTLPSRPSFSTSHDSYEDAVKVVEQEKMCRKTNMSKSTQYYLCNRVTTRS